MPFSLFHSYHCKYACVIMILMHLCMNIMHENYDNQCISFIFHIIFQSMYEIQTNNNDEQNTSTKKIDLLVSISSPTSTIQRSFLLMLLISCTTNKKNEPKRRINLYHHSAIESSAPELHRHGRVCAPN